jgi:deoxyribodipyrimidine photo-lyase
MTSAIYWFRQDLRLLDNPALNRAIENTSALLPVYCLPQQERSVWLAQRVGQHRQAFLHQAVVGLKKQLRSSGSDLLSLNGNAVTALIELSTKLHIQDIFCEDIAAPEEQAEIAALRKAGLRVTTVWQSSLLDPVDLPFSIDQLPPVFTRFRHDVEKAKCLPPPPLPAPTKLPPLPDMALSGWDQNTPLLVACEEPRSAFPYHLAAYNGSELAGLAHVKQYFESDLPQRYKLTRNGLIGTDYSTKFSPWLATGALSARHLFVQLRQHERQFGANDSTYWIWFELLWRDYFRFLHLQYGSALYRPNGLAPSASSNKHSAIRFQRWCEGNTGEPLVDAGMRELAASGYMSNRMRQIVASYLVHDLGCDYRAGAAWFEHQLVDYDPYSNQGNWLYGAGLGTDPRGGRRFNPDKQTREHDADGLYRARWSTP